MGYTIYYNNKLSNEMELGYYRRGFAQDFERIMEIFEIPESVGDSEPQSTEDPYFSDAKEHCSYKVFDNVCQLKGPHEWFVFPPESFHELDSGSNEPEHTGAEVFEFTKTNRKSYDLLVKLLYLLAQKHFFGEVSHDGEDRDYLKENLDSATDADKARARQVLFEVLEIDPLETDVLNRTF